MSEDETVLVGKLRARLDADAEMAALPRSIYDDDELLRFLSDVRPQFDLSAAFESLRNSLRMRERTELPVKASQIEAYREHVRVDGVARSGERAIILIMSRALQEELLQDPEPFLRAVVGILESVKAELFVPGKIESVQTIVQVERGFKLSLGSVPIAATQRLMSVVSDMYPSYTSRILVVNLPGYLAWFVKFIKGMLCEGSANKIELVTDYERLLEFYEESGLPELEGAELLIAKSKAAVIVVRMEPDTIIPGEGRDNWSVDGIVCYSKICTHVGCPISLYERTTHHLLCPCHQSTFDLSDSGRVVFGPAGRHLPQLPLAVDEEGFLVAQSDFTEPVGPTYWERDHKDIGDQGEAEL